MAVLVIGLISGFIISTVVHRLRSYRGANLAPARTEVDGAESQRSVAPIWADLDDVVGRHRVGVVLIGEDGQVRYRNAAARGFSGTHVGVLLDEAIERLGRETREGTGRRETVEFYGPPRSVFVIDAHPVGSGRSVVFVDDVSDARRLDRMRTDFVTNISHELKTPIGALSVLAEALIDEHDPVTIGRVVDRMISEAARAGRTVDDLLELSRIEHSLVDLEAESSEEVLTVDRIVAAAIGRVTEIARQRSIGVTALEPVDATGGRVGDVRLRGDRRQLESALGNLVENAVRYSGDAGTVQIRVRIDGDTVEFSVVDHGIGIPQRDLDRIFERFYRVDRARSRDTGGTGLGLSIVRHVAGNHGGAVTARSTEGEGSTFVLSLPIVADRQDDAAARHEGAA